MPIADFLVDDVPIHNKDIVLRNIYKVQYLYKERNRDKGENLVDEEKACFEVFFENVCVEMIKANVELMGELYVQDREIAEALLKESNRSTKIKLKQMLEYLGGLGKKEFKDKELLNKLHKVVENLSSFLDAKDIFLFGGYKGLFHSMEFKNSQQQEITGAVYLDPENILPHGLAKIELI